MDEAQIKALIESALKEFGTTFSTAILSQVDQKNAGLAASIGKELKKSLEGVQPTQPTQPEKPAEDKSADEGRLTLKALQQQLQQYQDTVKQLQTERDTERQSAFEARKKSLLSGSISNSKLLNPSIAQDVLEKRWGGNLAEENGNWFIKNGEAVTPFEQAFQTFVQSDEGKFFLPPSGTQGAGSTESKSTSTAGSTTLKASEALMQAF